MTRTLSALAGLGVALALAALAPAVTPTRVVATVGPGFTITLTKAGKRVTTLKPGTYAVTVRDRSNFHNFHLRGPSVNKNSGVARVTTMTWTLKFAKGRFSYVCDPHATMMKGSFTVR